jgi:hypothetical protein
MKILFELAIHLSPVTEHQVLSNMHTFPPLFYREKVLTCHNIAIIIRFIKHMNCVNCFLARVWVRKRKNLLIFKPMRLTPGILPLGHTTTSYSLLAA